jgi:hypothetical protein
MEWKIKQRFQDAFESCGAFFRDADLPPEVSLRYKVGLLLREPTFCDASHKFGGFLARHRYLIISANARCVDELVPDCDWGLCWWQTGRIFKIIGLHEKNGRRQTTLLEIPEDVLSYLWGPSLTELERDFATQAEDSFREAFSLLPVPELNKPQWLSRLTFPIGIDDQGNFFPLFEAPDSLTSSQVASATLEEAIAKYRAQPVFLPNGKTVTLGEVEDMDPEDRCAWSANMRDGDPDDIE